MCQLEHLEGIAQLKVENNEETIATKLKNLKGIGIKQKQKHQN